MTALYDMLEPEIVSASNAEKNIDKKEDIKE